MKKPIIGIAGDVFINTKAPVIGAEYDYFRNNYSKAIIEGGGIPLYIPVVDDISVLINQISACDGILIPGGEDVNPLFYGEEPKPLLQSTIPRVDRFQIHLIKEALKSNKPILTICRGTQILNVAFGGTLYQDISYASDNPIQHNQLTQLYDVTHSVEITKHSILYKLFGQSLLVNSAHHQSINKLGNGLFVTALASDGIVEGIELKGDKFVVGVQWHPEMLLNNNSNMILLFREFIKEALFKKGY